jgi:hypothetical protein
MSSFKRYVPFYEETDVEGSTMEDPFSSESDQTPPVTDENALDPNIETEVNSIIYDSTSKFYSKVVEDITTFILENKYDDSTKEKIMSDLVDRVKNAIDEYEATMHNVWSSAEETESETESEVPDLEEDEESEEGASDENDENGEND